MEEFHEGDLVVILKGDYLGSIVGSQAHLKVRREALDGLAGEWLAILTPEAQDAYAKAVGATWSSPEAREADRLKGWPVSTEYIRKVGV